MWLAPCLLGLVALKPPAANLPVAMLAPPERRDRMQRSRAVIYVDGNNLMAQRKVTKGREALAARLAGVRGAEVVLVFDGREGESHVESGHDPRVVVTSGGEGSERESADEWIVEQLYGGTSPSRTTDVSIVTADKLLRREAQRAAAATINPVKFWRRYLPRLKGLKTDYSNAPRGEPEDA